MDGPLQSAIHGAEEKSESSISKSSIPENELQSKEPEITVAGIGGGGNNTIDRISSKGIKKVEKVAINTDCAHLKRVKADQKIPIGEEITQGRGTGGAPKIGKRAAKNSGDRFREIFRGSDLVFLACGLGGGTGTGGAPVAAEIAKEEGAVVTGVVTMPFGVEKKDKVAREGLKDLRKYADSVIVIDNNRLSDMASEFPMRYAFSMADEVLTNTLKGIIETITIPSLINLDFADFKAIMEKDNIVLVGTGEAEGDNRAEKSVRQALECPLLGDVDYSTADGVIMHVSGSDVKLSEAEKIGKIIRNKTGAQSQRILGARVNRELGNTLQTILLISGVSSPLILGQASENVLGPAPEHKTKTLRESSRKKAETPLNLNINHL